MKDDRSTPDGADLHIVGWTTDRTGVINLVTAVPAGSPGLDYAFEGGDGDLRAVLPKSVDGEEGLSRAAPVAGDRDGGEADGLAHAFTSMADRRPSENRLNEIETMKMASPGRAATIGFT